MLALRLNLICIVRVGANACILNSTLSSLDGTAITPAVTIGEHGDNAPTCRIFSVQRRDRSPPRQHYQPLQDYTANLNNIVKLYKTLHPVVQAAFRQWRKLTRHVALCQQ